nr:RapH N-terminal domain-containing protein [Bacillus safensis]
MKKIRSSQIGILINDWYRFIRTFSVPNAEILKEQVEREIENMEEDQDYIAKLKIIYALFLKNIMNWR